MAADDGEVPHMRSRQEIQILGPIQCTTCHKLEQEDSIRQGLILV
jgi:hypothetical protein